MEEDPRTSLREGRPKSVGEVKKIDLNGRKFKLGASVKEAFEGALKEVLLKNMNAFAWSVADMPGIDPDFLYHHLMIDQ